MLVLYAQCCCGLRAHASAEEGAAHYRKYSSCLMPGGVARRGCLKEMQEHPRLPPSAKPIRLGNRRNGTRCLSGRLDCLEEDPYEAALERRWEAAKPHPRASTSASGGGGAAAIAVLDTLMEAVSFAIEKIHGGEPKRILGDRTWWGMGTIGNRPSQANAYYDLVEREAARTNANLTICEIGLNGGHSAILFLEAAGRGARMVSFDLGSLAYTRTALSLVHRLYPGQMRYIEGNSSTTAPLFARQHGRVCDVMSIDGGHSASVVRADLEAARRMSKPGALLFLDDMIGHRDDLGRAGVEAAARDGLIAQLQCTTDRVSALSTSHRFATHGPARYIALAWCHARIT